MSSLVRHAQFVTYLYEIGTCSSVLITDLGGFIVSTNLADTPVNKCTTQYDRL